MRIVVSYIDGQVKTLASDAEHAGQNRYDWINEAMTMHAKYDARFEHGGVYVLDIEVTSTYVDYKVVSKHPLGTRVVSLMSDRNGTSR